MMYHRLRALLWLRVTILRHGLRRSSGVTNMIVTILLALIGLAASGGLAVILANLTSAAAATGDEDSLEICFAIACYSIAFFAVVVPCFLGMEKKRLQISRLAIFPIPHRTLYSLDLASSATSANHLFWYPAMGATAVWGVVMTSAGTPPGLTILMMLSAVLIVWCHTLQCVLHAVIRKRSVKELVGVGAFTLLMMVSLLPALVDSGVIGVKKAPGLLDVALEIVQPVARTLPPSLAAVSLTDLHMGATEFPSTTIAWLAVWLLAGAAAGYLMFSRTVLSSGSGTSAKPRGERPAQPRETSPTRMLNPLGWLPNDVAAVAGKEIHYILRSTPGKLVLLVAPIFVVMISLAVGRLMFAKEVLFGIEPATYAFFGVLLYGSLLAANFLVNSFAWEGEGLKAYLINPMSSRRLILGKNVGVALFEGLILAEVLFVWFVVKGPLGIVETSCGVLVFVSGLLILAIPGNFVSIAYPVKRSISALSNSASSVGTLVSLAGTAVTAGLVGSLLILGLVIGGGPAQLVLLTFLVASLVAVYAGLLNTAADLFDERMESLLDALSGRTEDSN